MSDWTGAATGTLLLFIDADTRHAPDLVTRMVRVREDRGVELLSVAGKQFAGTISRAPSMTRSAGIGLSATSSPKTR